MADNGVAAAISLSASVALNHIADSVTATVDHANVTVTGAVTVGASNTASITATPVGVAIAVASSSSGVAGAAALAGAVATNDVTTPVSKKIGWSCVQEASVSVSASGASSTAQPGRSSDAASFVTELRRETTRVLRDSLGDQRLRALRAEGEAMDTDEAVAHALDAITHAHPVARQ